MNTSPDSVVEPMAHVGRDQPLLERLLLPDLAPNLVPISPPSAFNGMGEPFTGAGKAPALRQPNGAYAPIPGWQARKFTPNELREHAAGGGNLGLRGSITLADGSDTVDVATAANLRNLQPSAETPLPAVQLLQRVGSGSCAFCPIVRPSGNLSSRQK